MNVLKILKGDIFFEISNQKPEESRVGEYFYIEKNYVEKTVEILLSLENICLSIYFLSADPSISRSLQSLQSKLLQHRYFAVKYFYSK